MSLSLSEAVTPDPSRAIARSRSRYKGPRPNKALHSTREPPHLSADQLQTLRDVTPVPKINGYTAPLEAESRRKTKDHGTIDATVETHAHVHQVPRFRDRGRREDMVEVSHPARVGQIRKPDRGLRSPSGRVPPKSPIRPSSARFEQRALNDGPVALPKKSLTQRIIGQKSGDSLSKSREKLKRTISGPIPIDSSETTVAPAFDAPISAINSGERKVAVKYGDLTVSLPVSLSTTPEDIVRLVGDQIADALSSRNAIVQESYRQLGLERPLRKYEHVRNIMNSWDNDMQNKLIVTHSNTGRDKEALELSHVPRVQPGDTSVSIYHSQRPGHWDKRWATLRSDGQILVAKSDGGEASNICHLSDFDIYIPTPRQLSKKIRPPRKMCFAIKSQQKSNMFMTTVNFVHFFSTGNRDLATAWYKAVQEWRSWYLVNIMGEGSKNTEISENPVAREGHQTSTDIQPKAKIFGRSSLGSEDGGIQTARKLSRGRTVRDRSTPPVSYPNQIIKYAETSSSKTHGEAPLVAQTPGNLQHTQPFAASSLLGRTYTQRRQAQQKQETSQPRRSSPPPALPIDPNPSDGLKRTSSQRQKPRPLVDLTPQYREPPQHSTKGRGIILEQIPAGGLVEIATSPEEAIPLPPTTTWQRPGTSSSRNEAGIERSATFRRDRSATSTVNRKKSKSPDKSEAPFTGGLLVGNSRGLGGTGIGKGVRTGDREAKAPMLDVAKESEYASGSLLARVEERDGGPQLNINREKRREVDAVVGERT